MQLFLTTGAAARLIDRSPEMIRYYARTGRLRAVRTTTGQRLFTEADVLRLRDRLLAR